MTFYSLHLHINICTYISLHLEKHDFYDLMCLKDTDSINYCIIMIDVAWSGAI